MARESFAAKFEVHVSDEKRNTFTGIASVPGSLILPQAPSYMPTIIMPRAFKKTLQERGDKLKIDRQHENVIGKVLSAHESDNGLNITGHVSDTTEGRDTLALMRDQVLTELSIEWKPVASGVEFMTGSKLLEQLGKRSVGREVCALIKENVAGYGLNEKYRVVNELILYRIGIVDEGADPLTQIVEVNKKKAQQKEDYAMLGYAEVMEQIGELVAALSACCTPSDLGDGNTGYTEYGHFSQIIYISSAITTLAQMPIAMAEQMSKAPASEQSESIKTLIESFVASITLIEKHAGRMISGKNLKLIKDAKDALQKLIEAAEPVVEEDSKQPLQTEPQDSTPNKDDSALLNERNKLAQNILAAQLCLTQEMMNETGNYRPIAKSST